MAPTEILAEQHFITIRKLLEASRFRVALLTGATPAQEAPRGAGGAVGRIDPPRRRHARARAGPGRRSASWAGHHRRAAPVRRHAARDAARQGAAPRRAGDDRHADSAHAGADDLRRSRRVDHARDAAGPAADQDHREAGIAPRRDLRVHPASRSTTGRQAYVIYPLVEESEKVDLKAATEMADHLAQDVFPAYRVGAAARADEAGREGPRHGRVRARRVRHPRLDDGRRSRRRRARTPR